MATLSLPEPRVWERERARRSLIEFIKFTKPEYKTGWFNTELCAVLDQFLADVVAEKSPRLIIEAPPRHGKTEAASRRFPAYALGRHPYLTFIATSYASDLASSINRDVQRVIDAEEYHELFPDTTLWGKNIRTVADGSYLRNSDIFEIVGKRGVYKSAGVGAGIGGRGGECFPAGTMVTTDRGQLPIEELNSCTTPIYVLSFNQGVGLEWKKLAAWQERKSTGLRRVTTTSGRVVEATADHLFYTDRGWIESRLLAPGDSLLLAMQEEVSAVGLGDGEAVAAGPHGCLLLGSLLDGASRDEEQPLLRRVWRDRGASSDALRRAQNGPSQIEPRPRSGVSICEDDLPNMQHGVHGSMAWVAPRPCEVLLEGVLGAWALTTDEWHRQPEVEERCDASATATALCESVSCDAPTDLEARWLRVRGVQEAQADSIGGASSGQRSNEQRCIESRHAVLPLSPGVARCEGFKTIEDTVALVEELREEACVYDIQVEGNHNFFANDILVHNCLIVDDPIKDAAEAGSDVVRKGIWEWFTSTLYTRAMPGGGILVIMTRWHESDLAGTLIANAKKDGEDWQIVRFPAIAEEDEFSAIDGKLLRKEGEALHPERYSLEALAKIKVAVGSRVWASLYQQRPSAAEGNKFKRDDWRTFKPTYGTDTLDLELFRQWCDSVGVKQVIQRWDTALGEKKSDDWTACTTLAIAHNRYYVLEVWKAKIEFPEVKRAVQQRYDKWRPAKVFVEGGGSASGKATVQAMKRDSVVPIFESITATDKSLRADTVTPSHEAGLISVPEGVSWVADFIDSCSNFPNAAHDDDVDSFIGAMEEALGNPGPMIITDEFLAAMGVSA